jgi:hypothetical protein
MMYYNGQYFLSTETYEAAIWRTRIYSGPTASGPFTQLPGNPVLSDNDACFFQHIFGTTMHAWYCKLTGSTWTLEHRTADLTAGQPQLAILNSAKWTLGAGTWTALTMTQQDGTAGIVAQIVGDTSHSGSEILRASYTGSDYIIEAAMRLTAGRVMGLGARVSDEDNLYTVNLYQDRDPLTNLFVYRWIADSATTLSEVNVGPISFSTWYKMTVKAHGPNIDVSLNDVPYVSTTDPLNQYPSGSLALAGEGATTAQFNDLRVRQYAAQEPTVTVAEEGPSAVTLQQFTARAAPTSNEVWLLLSTAALIVGGGIIIIRRHSSGRMTKEHHDL